jgi:hypothetical protein
LAVFLGFVFETVELTLMKTLAHRQVLDSFSPYGSMARQVQSLSKSTTTTNNNHNNTKRHKRVAFGAKKKRCCFDPERSID